MCCIKIPTMVGIVDLDVLHYTSRSTIPGCVALKFTMEDIVDLDVLHGKIYHGGHCGPGCVAW